MIEEVLHRSIARLHNDELTNTAQIKQAVVIPILRALGWDDTNPNEVKPDHSVGDRSVDYALFHENNPLVFICVDREQSDFKEIFALSAHISVLFLILIGGKIWELFLCGPTDVPQEQRFCSIELQLDKIKDHTILFKQLLHKDSVGNQETKHWAEERLGRRTSQNAIPGVWASLVEDEDDILYDLIKEEVKSTCGHQPANDDIKEFLTGTITYRPKATDENTEQPISTIGNQSTLSLIKWNHNNRIIGFNFNDERTITRRSSRTLAALVSKFQRLNPNFIQQFAERTTTPNRRLVAKNIDDLYVNTNLRDRYAGILDGWYIGTNYPQYQIRDFIKLACNIMRIEVGDDHSEDYYH